MATKRPVGRPYKKKYIVLEWLFLWWLGTLIGGCLLYTSDAADEEDSVDLGGRRII